MKKYFNTVLEKKRKIKFPIKTRIYIHIVTESFTYQWYMTKSIFQ